MKKYIVQTRNEDGAVSLSANTAEQIVNFYGFSDCSGCDFHVFDGSVFGEMVELVHEVGRTEPNYHSFIRPDTGRIEFDGYSAEH